MSAPFKIAEIAEPKFPVQLADGTVKEFDPWKLQQEIADGQQAAKTAAASYDVIRAAFGFQTQAQIDADVAAGGMAAVTLSLGQCVGIVKALGDFIDSLPVSKKG